MNIRIKTLCLILFACISFTACGVEGVPGIEKQTEEQFICPEDISDYAIIRSDFAGKDETAISVDLKQAFASAGYNDMAVRTDWIENENSVSEKEILMGNTNREESAEFSAYCEARSADCGYGLRNGKIVLYGKTVELLKCCEEKMKADLLGTAENLVLGETETPKLTEGSSFLYTCTKKMLLEDGSKPVSSLRDDILWGVNGHNKGHLPYTEENTDDIILLAAEMGSTIYRINYNPVDEAMLGYINSVIDRLHAYGMQVMLVLDNMYGTVEEISERMTYIAENLNGKVEYFQIFNETDIWCSLKDDGSFYNVSNWTGMTEEYYNPERVAICVEKVGAAVKAFRETAPDAKLVINIGSRHFPILDWYVKAGISWDIIAIDQYDLTTWNTPSFLKEMEERYPEYDFMIAEFNYPANSGKYVEEEQAYWLETFFKQMNDYGSSRLKAVIAYELMDESVIQTDESWNGEAHFGIVNTGDNGKPGTVKQGYRTLQNLLCGGICSEQTVFQRIND